MLLRGGPSTCPLSPVVHQPSSLAEHELLKLMILSPPCSVCIDSSSGHCLPERGFPNHYLHCTVWVDTAQVRCHWEVADQYPMRMLMDTVTIRLSLKVSEVDFQALLYLQYVRATFMRPYFHNF